MKLSIILHAVTISFMCLSSGILAFDLNALEAKLQKTENQRGDFIQEKFLRSLPNPLLSKGGFVLSKEKGLLWFVRSPISQDLKIQPKGVFRKTAAGWIQSSSKSAAAQQSTLFMAILSGDSSGLRQSFDLSLSGNENTWQLVMTPKSPLMRQIFTTLVIHGGDIVSQIDINETQGDRTVVKLQNVKNGAELTLQERSDFDN